MPQNLTVIFSLPPAFPQDEQTRARFAAAAPGAALHFFAADEQPPRELVERADIWVGDAPPQIWGMANNLKLLQLWTAGADVYCRQADKLPAGARLAVCSGAYGLCIAEYMVCTLLMLMRKLHTVRDNQHREVWQPPGRVRSIHGSNILIVGVGDLGGEFAKRVKALGAYTVGVRRRAGGKPEYLDELHLSGELDAMPPGADVVALCMPSTAETRGMFGEARLRRMSANAILINVGCGDAVDCAALAALLEEGALAGAVMDVTDPEPLPAGHPLWRAPNALVTPHCSGRLDLDHTVEVVVDIICDNLARFASGRALRNVVDLDAGYRISKE